nr:MAG TPA: hypothetical protein [Caudoviricetes sp.]
MEGHNLPDSRDCRPSAEKIKKGSTLFQNPHGKIITDQPIESLAS